MAKRLGIGLIGAGFVGKFHVRSLLGVRHADIVAICSRTRKSAAEAAELAHDLGVGDPKVYTSVAEMTADPAVDAVWICVPNFARLEVMEAVAAAGQGKLKGVACEKPLGRNVAEARRMLELAQGLGCPHGYLENQLFMPPVARGKEIVWRRGAATTGRPYLARSAEEHGGPHEPWFWSGEQQGGGVLNDMMCHSLEAARFLLCEPGKPRSSMTVKTVSCDIASLKWTRDKYAAQLKSEMAWGYVGPGLRLTVEVMGPEYSMAGNSLNNHLQVFLSRNVSGAEGEDIVEKQTAEQGLMPVVTDEEIEYGYTAENRHMVDCFRNGETPIETFADGLEVTKLLMACYMSAEQGRRLDWEPPGLDEFIPAVAKGTWSYGA